MAMGLHPLPKGLDAANPAVWIATWFGSGLVRPAPGTIGSLAALPIAWVALWLGGSLLLGVMIFLLFALGLWATNAFISADNDKDPSSVVVDEVVGQWIALLGASLSLGAFLVAFGAFRFFDILKPWPVSWADKSISGAMGVMLDDILAGIYALILLLAVRTFAMG